MRELKFRGWDGLEMSNTASLFRLIDTDYSRNMDKVIWMQFTGLTDKNGVEIYEGDVVRNEKGENYKVGWNINGLWSYKRLSDNSSFMQDWWTTEVIGNIYENPELLENGDD